MPNTSYFLNNTNTKRLKFYDINKNAITSDWDLTSAGSQSFTTLSNTYYLRFSIDINATDINTIQLERGTKATPYEPYIQPNEVTFNLSDEKLMSAKTYNSSSIVQDTLTVDLTTGNYYKEEIFDNLYNITGDEEVQYIEDNTYPYFVIRKASGNAGFVWCNIAKNIVTIANMMKPENNNTFFWNSGSIGFRFDDITSIDDFKNKIKELNQNSHQVYVVQPDSLALLPTTKLLGTLSAEDLAKLKTFKGYNNVTVNTNLGLMNIRFTYGLDIKKYVDNKIAQLSEQLIKGE